MNTKRLIATTVAFSIALGSLPMRAQADIVPTEALLPATLTQAGIDNKRASIKAFLAREDVRQALMQQGVDADQALARVDAMSDDEAADMADRIAQAPAGGDVLGIVFTVFIILLVTDILGLTKVFPFTRSVR
ncbi:MAG: PA2779 family protein [Paucibacter sp.]|nr:PA2779 family protein [Roseateles sp.]